MLYPAARLSVDDTMLNKAPWGLYVTVADPTWHHVWLKAGADGAHYPYLRAMGPVML